MREWRASLNLMAEEDEGAASRPEPDPAPAADERPAQDSGQAREGVQARERDGVQARDVPLREREGAPNREGDTRPPDGRMVLSIRDYDDRRNELVTQVHAQAERYFRELITVERTAAMNQVRLEEREAAAKQIEQAQRSIKAEAAAEIDAAVKREQGRLREVLTQEQRLAKALRQLWVVVASAVGLVVGAGAVLAVLVLKPGEPVRKPEDRVVPPAGSSAAAAQLEPAVGSGGSSAGREPVSAPQSKPGEKPGEEGAKTALPIIAPVPVDAGEAGSGSTKSH